MRMLQAIVYLTIGMYTYTVYDAPKWSHCRLSKHANQTWHGSQVPTRHGFTSLADGYHVLHQNM